MQFMARLPLVMLFHFCWFWLIPVSLCSLLLWSSFSTVSSSLRELLQLCWIFSRLLCGISQSFGFIRIIGFPPLIPPCSTLLIVVSSSHQALLPVSPSSTASACHLRHLLSLFHFPASFGDTVHILLSAPSVSVRFLLF